MSTNTSGKKKPAKKKSSSKAAPEKKAKPEPIHSETIQAPYHFTPAEVEGMNIELRETLQTAETLEDQKKQANKDFALRIEGVKNRTKQLLNKLQSGTETRPLEARVEFSPKLSKKTYYHPTTGALIREEDMQPADWQLPMFKKAPDGKEVVGPEASKIAEKTTPTKPAAAPKTSPAGATSVGDALDKAAAQTKAPTIVLDLTKEDWDHVALTKAFKKSAKAAKWTEAQTSLVIDRLRECDTVPKMMDTLRPFTIPDPQTERDEKYRSIIDSAKRDFTDREKMMEHFKCILADYPAMYPGGDSEKNFNRFVADIRDAIHPPEGDATKL